MKQPGEYSSLFKRYLSGQSSQEELDELFHYFRTSKEEDLRMLILLELEKEDEPSAAMPEESGRRIDALYGNIEKRINDTGKTRNRYTRFLDLRIITAAAAVVLLALVLTLHLSKREESAQKTVTNAKTDIAPGGNKAVLTLPNGRRIILDDAKNGKLASTSGISVTKTSAGQIVYRAEPAADANKAPAEPNSIATPKGGQFQVILPDGTKAWLNAASEIRFPSYFGSGKRIVDIRGEAYFEVAKVYSGGTQRKRLPFIVRTNYQDIEVLGTHFNVNAYEEEGETTTTLLEGKVVVHSTFSNTASRSSAAVLKPGQQAVNDHQHHSLLVQKAETDDAMAWKNGLFSFNDADIGTIMRQISRWYNVDVVYKGNVEGKRFGGFVSRYEKVSQVLEILESTGAIHFKIEERRITVMP